MSVVTVHASRTYEVRIERGILDRAGELLRPLTEAGTAVIVSGERVMPLYGDRLERSLRRAGFSVIRWIHPSGEEHKNLNTYGALLEFLADSRVTRSDLLLALGGGVTGDLTGFAAATFLRGMDYVQIPTSLLAMVDSSVGGKTAVDLRAGKNLAGCFYQPLSVLCDPNTLDTLPEEQLRCGWAEVIKYAVLGDASFFEELSRGPAGQDMERVIRRCVSMKTELVTEDEFDRGRRQLLNLGHSFGHAVEACSGFEILHGQAVAIGMAMIARAACARGVCEEETVDRLVTLLENYGLPTETEIPAERLLSALLSDKKRRGDCMNLVLPEVIGNCSARKVPMDELTDWLRLGGAK